MNWITEASKLFRVRGVILKRVYEFNS